MLQINPNSPPNIEKLVEMASPVLKKRERLYRRIERDSSQTSMMFDSSKGGKVAYEQQNVGVATGYLGGAAPTIKNVMEDELNKEYISKLNDIFRYNDFASKHLDMVQDTMSANAHYFYIYANQQSRIIFSGISSKNTVAFYDYEIEPNLVLILRQWQEVDSENHTLNVAEVITKANKVQYESKNSTTYTQRPDKSELLQWGDIPVCSFEGVRNAALIEPIIPLVKIYEQIIENIASMTNYNDNAKLLMIGYNFEGPAIDENGHKTSQRVIEEKELLSAPILEVESDGDFRWLLKEINYSGMLEVLKTLQQLIMFVVASPDTTDTTFSAAESSLALRLKMFPFEQAATTYKALYKKQYLRLIEIITNRLNFLKDPTLTLEKIALMTREEKKSKGLYDFANIEVEINVNIPSDKLKAIGMAGEVARLDKVSDKTILSLLAESGIIKDAESELALKKAQDEEEFEKVKVAGEDVIQNE